MKTSTYCTIKEAAQEVLGDDIICTAPIRYRNWFTKTPRRARVVIVDFYAGSRMEAMRKCQEIFRRVNKRALVFMRWGGYDEDMGIARLECQAAGFAFILDRALEYSCAWRQTVETVGAILLLLDGWEPTTWHRSALYCMCTWPPIPGVDWEVYACTVLRRLKEKVAALVYPVEF